MGPGLSTVLDLDIFFGEGMSRTWGKLLALRLPSGLGLDGLSLSAERDADGVVGVGATSVQNCVVSTGDMT